jgi:hypothetical protein
MRTVQLTAKRRGFLDTKRKDGWWISPLLTFLGLSTFIVYSTWAAFQNAHYWHDGYLSPFYSPEIFGNSPHSIFGAPPTWWPAAIPFSPAFLILWAPGGFRFTCYYYRGAYYKAFWGDPPACAVGELRNTYLGENSLPLIFQNIHRYFLYIAIAFIALLAYDVYNAMWFTNAATGAKEFGIGLGTLVLALNVYLLGSYTFGCHSFRHLIGGVMNVFSTSPARKKTYECVSALNRKHMLFAWCSLFSVGFSDVYVRCVSMGIWSDWRIF